MLPELGAPGPHIHPAPRKLSALPGAHQAMYVWVGRFCRKRHRNTPFLPSFCLVVLYHLRLLLPPPPSPAKCLLSREHTRQCMCGVGFAPFRKTPFPIHFASVVLILFGGYCRLPRHRLRALHPTFLPVHANRYRLDWHARREWGNSIINRPRRSRRLSLYKHDHSRNIYHRPQHM